MSGCVIFGLGLMFVVAGANVFARSDMMQDKAIGAIAVLAGVWLWSLVFDMARADGIDVSVNNRIVAQDGEGRYLVKAKTRYQILGPRPHVSGNLPAGLYQQRKGLWIVDSTGGPEPDSRNIDWKPMSGNYHIEPRGNTKTGGYLRDVMEGWEHKYIVEDE